MNAHSKSREVGRQVSRPPSATDRGESVASAYLPRTSGSDGAAAGARLTQALTRPLIILCNRPAEILRRLVKRYPIDGSSHVPRQPRSWVRRRVPDGSPRRSKSVGFAGRKPRAAKRRHSQADPTPAGERHQAARRWPPTESACPESPTTERKAEMLGRAWDCWQSDTPWPQPRRPRSRHENRARLPPSENLEAVRARAENPQSQIKSRGSTEPEPKKSPEPNHEPEAGRARVDGG